MPGSAIGAGPTDFILPPSGIAEQLGRIARQPYIATPGARKDRKGSGARWEQLPQSGLATIFGLLRSRSNVDFSFYKHSTLRRRIVRRMVLHKMDTLPAYVKYLEGHPGE